MPTDVGIIKEALESLAHEASFADSSDSAQGIDTLGQIEQEALDALARLQGRIDADERFLRDLTFLRNQIHAAQVLVKQILAHEGHDRADHCLEEIVATARAVQVVLDRRDKQSCGEPSCVERGVDRHHA